PGKGISVAPVTPTGRFGTNLQQYYAAASCGDFTSYGVYGLSIRPWEVKRDNPFFPYVIRVNDHPLMEQPIDLFRVPGKPYVIYECKDYRPNPYTAEFPMRIATMLIQKDADGAFFFHWDDKGYLPNLRTDKDYVTNRMPMPDRSYPNAGLVHCNDEAGLAVIKAAGTMFRDARVPPAKNPTEVRIGKDWLFKLTGGLITRLEEQVAHTTALRQHAWREGVRTVFDPDGPSKLPKPVTDASKHIDMGPYIDFDWNNQAGHIRVDAPTVKAYVGFSGPFLKFKGLTVSGLKLQWNAIFIVSEDGKPL
ncbi:MAG: hypothetical protein GY851_32110, partial [bacterium]|nr:hypothetical protein [bacterium]